jgi:hypothetical protein
MLGTRCTEPHVPFAPVWVIFPGDPSNVSHNRPYLRMFPALTFAAISRGPEAPFLSMLAAAVASVAGCSSFNLRPIEAMRACLDAAAKA